MTSNHKVQSFPGNVKVTFNLRSAAGFGIEVGQPDTETPTIRSAVLPDSNSRVLIWSGVV